LDKKKVHKRNLAGPYYYGTDSTGAKLPNFYVFTANATELASTPASIGT
jgi:hypothetical protein